MKRSNGSWAIAALAGLAGAALGQNYDIYRVPKDITEYRPDLSTAPSLAVGLNRVVVLGSHRMTMFDKASPINPLSPLDFRRWGPVSYGTAPNDYPFRPASVFLDPFYNALVFPEAAYDPITGHVWMLYGEAVDVETTSPSFIPARPEALGICVPRLHVAASRSTGFTNFNARLPMVSPPVPDPNGFTYWTDFSPIDPASSVLGGTALRLDELLTIYDPLAAAGEHSPISGSFIYPSIGFETDDVIITGVDPSSCPLRSELNTTGEQVILFIPRQFSGPGGPTTIHDGGRIDETSEIKIARMKGDPNIDDESFQACIVQEPYEQWENVALMLSTDGSVFTGVDMQGIRLKGVFKGPQGVPTPADSNWRIRQSLQTFGSDLILKDMSIAPMQPLSGAPSPDFYYPKTPTATFRPAVIDEAFTTAVMARDNAGNARVFAAHHGLVFDSPTEPRLVIQWYVIDPDLGPEVVPATTPPTYQHFHTPLLDTTTWSPSIVAQGRIELWDPEDQIGNCYHPVVGVTRQGRLSIEYTFSSPTVDQRIVRATIDNTYTSVASYSVVQNGPSTGYGDVEDRWALYGDLQADPQSCRFWSTHTLVEDADERDVWLFKRSYNCFSPDMNANMVIEPEDALLYDLYFAAQDERADADFDGQVDAFDAMIFLDRYSTGEP
ncbi:MAG: hypothetical protein RIB58_02385 [Phycisphaerales bacterium]